MNEAKIREHFEDWLVAHVQTRTGRIPDLTRLADGPYVNPDHQRRWEAWLAAYEEYRWD